MQLLLLLRKWLLGLGLWLVLSTHYPSLVLILKTGRSSGTKSDQLRENQIIKKIVNNHLCHASGLQVGGATALCTPSLRTGLPFYTTCTSSMQVSCQTAVDWYNFVRDVCAQYFLDHPAVIGMRADLGKENLIEGGV